MRLANRIFSIQKSGFSIALHSFLTLSLLLVFEAVSFSQNLNIKKYNCRLSKEDTEIINKIASYEAAFYDAVFETGKNDSLVIGINIFGRKADFMKTPDGAGALHVSSDGYYLETDGEVYALKTDHVNEALLHEISHAFLHHNISHPPKWFDEGLATYFGSLIVQDKQIFYTPVTGRIARIKELNDEKKLKLLDFLQTTNRNWGDDQQQITDQYTIAYSIIYFLVKTNLNLVKQMAVGLKNGQSATAIFAEMFSSFEAFQIRYTNFYNHEN